jgi:hypothetical protein
MVPPEYIGISHDEHVFYSNSVLNVIHRINSSTNVVEVYAGNGQRGYSGDNGLATSARLNYPSSLGFDSSNNLHIVDNGNHVVRKVSISSNTITTLVNIDDSISSFVSSRRLRYNEMTVMASTIPDGSSVHNIAFDSEDNLFISDSRQNIVIMLNSSSGVASLFAGVVGTAGFQGDQRKVTTGSVLFNNPLGLAFDKVSYSLIVVDNGNSRVRAISLSTGIIRTIIGNGDVGYNGGGKPATKSALANPTAVVVDDLGNIYISDRNNSFVRVRSATKRLLYDLIGTGVAGYNGDDVSAKECLLNYPAGLALGSTIDKLYIADTENVRIRRAAFFSPFDLSPTRSPVQVADRQSDDNIPVEGGFITIWVLVGFFSAAFAVGCCCCFYICFFVTIWDEKQTKIDWYRLDIDPLDLVIDESGKDKHRIDIDDVHIQASGGRESTTFGVGLSIAHLMREEDLSLMSPTDMAGFNSLEWANPSSAGNNENSSSIFINFTEEDDRNANVTYDDIYDEDETVGPLTRASANSPEKFSSSPNKK